MTNDGAKNVGAWVGGVIVIVIMIVLLLVLLRWICQGKRYKQMNRIDGKVVIITGANTGIGKASAIDLARRGARVYMACRDTKRGEHARDDVVRATGNTNVFNCKLDLASFESVRNFVHDFKQGETRLDILINNAGVITTERRLTVDGYEMQIGVNHMGHFLLTLLLLDMLKASAPSRIVVVSSAAHLFGSIDTNDLNCERKPYKKYSAYSQSKLANVLFARELSRRIKGTGVTVNSVHPGVVRTELTRDLTVLNVFLWIFTFFYKTPMAGAQTQIRVAIDPELSEVTGKYFENCKVSEEGAKAKDDVMAAWLWSTSEIWTQERAVIRQVVD